MHIHVPKMLHSWRELAREVAIIVVGVLIALFLEQLVEAWHWRQKVSTAEAAMRRELLEDDGPQIYQRAAMHPCVVASLDAIRAAVESGRDRTDIANLIDKYWMDFRTYDQLALNAATASDVASHMPREQLNDMTDVYETMPLMERTNAQEAMDFARLRAFRRTGGTVSDEEKDRLLGAVEALRSDDQIIWLKTRTKLPELRKVGLLDRSRTNFFMSNARDHYGACVRDLPPNFGDKLPRAS
jgi:hypothetical protein